MKLYHGTSNRNAKYIEAEGFIGGELSEFTMMKLVEGGVVYMAKTIEEASEYGDVIFEIDFDMMDCEQPIPFSDGNTEHFYSSADNINGAALIRRIN